MQGLHPFNLVSGNLLMNFSGSFNPASDGHPWNEECYIFHLLEVLVL